MHDGLCRNGISTDHCGQGITSSKADGWRNRGSCLSRTAGYMGSDRMPSGVFSDQEGQLAHFDKMGYVGLVKNHQAIDRRSLFLHRLIARRLQRNPAFLEQARGTVSRWLMSRPDEPALREWSDLLSRMSHREVARLLCSRSEAATRLRQSSPFTGVLSIQERGRVLRRHASA